MQLDVFFLMSRCALLGTVRFLVASAGVAPPRLPPPSRLKRRLTSFGVMWRCLASRRRSVTIVCRTDSVCHSEQQRHSKPPPTAGDGATNDHVITYIDKYRGDLCAGNVLPAPAVELQDVRAEWCITAAEHDWCASARDGVFSRGPRRWRLS